jgi:hypothetical protein
MAIEKKSLISNRTATKKALVAKPEVTKTGITRNKAGLPRLSALDATKVLMHHPRVAAHNPTRVLAANAKVCLK